MRNLVKRYVAAMIRDAKTEEGLTEENFKVSIFPSQWNHQEADSAEHRTWHNTFKIRDGEGIREYKLVLMK